MSVRCKFVRTPSRVRTSPSMSVAVTLILYSRRVCIPRFACKCRHMYLPPPLFCLLLFPLLLLVFLFLPFLSFSLFVLFSAILFLLFLPLPPQPSQFTPSPESHSCPRITRVVAPETTRSDSGNVGVLAQTGVVSQPDRVCLYFLFSCFCFVVPPASLFRDKRKRARRVRNCKQNELTRMGQDWCMTHSE